MSSAPTQAAVSLPTLLAIFDHFVIANTGVSNPIVYGALIGELVDGNQVSIHACYESHHRSGPDFEENAPYEDDLVATLCQEGSLVGWYSWNIKDKSVIHEITTHYACKMKGHPILHISFSQESHPHATLYLNANPIQRAANIRLTVKPLQGLDDIPRICFIIERLIHRVSIVLANTPLNFLSLFHSLLSCLEQAARLDSFGPNNCSMDAQSLQRNLQRLLTLDNNTRSVVKPTTLCPPNCEIINVEESRGKWEMQLRFGTIYMHVLFTSKPHLPKSLEGRTAFIHENVLRYMPEWVIQILRHSASDAHPTYVSFNTNDSGNCKYHFLVRPLPTIKPWHPVVIDELSLLNRRRWMRTKLLWRCEVNGKPAVAKCLSWPEYLEYAVQETEMYRIIDDHHLGPEFFGHLKRNGRIVGIIVAKVEGHFPTVSDIPACLEVLDRLHHLGIRHGDVHPGNFIVAHDGPVMIDFEAGGSWDDNHPEDIRRLITLESPGNEDQEIDDDD